MWNASLFLAGLVLCFAVLADVEAQAAASAGMPLSPPLLALTVIAQLRGSAGTNQAARLSPPTAAIRLPLRESSPAVTNMTVGPAPGTTPVARADPVPARLSSPMVWDAEAKEYHAKLGETNAQFAFSLTNIGPTEVLINEVRTSCGGAVGILPEYPWRLAPGTNGQVQEIADLRGKRGLLHKMVYVHTSNHGIQPLAIKVNIPDSLFEQPRRQDAKLNSDEFGKTETGRLLL